MLKIVRLANECVSPETETPPNKASLAYQHFRQGHVAMTGQGFDLVMNLNDALKVLELRTKRSSSGVTNSLSRRKPPVSTREEVCSRRSWKLMRHLCFTFWNSPKPPKNGKRQFPPNDDWHDGLAIFEYRQLALLCLFASSPCLFWKSTA